MPTRLDAPGSARAPLAGAALAPGAPAGPPRAGRVRARRRRALAPSVALALAACGGGGGGGGGDDGGGGGGGGGGGEPLGRPGAFEVVELGPRSFTDAIPIYGARFSATAPIAVPLAADTVSFALLTDLSSTGDLGILGALEDPAGADLTPGSSVDEYLEGPLKPNADDGALSLVVPKSPDLLPAAGDYSFRVLRNGPAQGSVPVAVAVRRGDPQGRRIPMNVLVHPFSGTTPEEVAPVLELTRAIYQRAGLDLDPIETFVAGDVSNAVVTSVGPGSDVEDVFALRGPLEDAVTIYLLLDVSLEEAGGTLLGLSGGIPGSFGWPRPTDNGVLVSVSAHRNGDGELLPAFLATTIAHETGHWLGLNHTSEAEGESFDPIGDTPECPRSRDLNRDGQVGPLECPDGDNLMFWTGFTNDGISLDQAEMLARAPIVVP